jgi:hypothetical protein
VFSQFNAKNECFHVELKGFEVAAGANISAYTDATGLNRFFQELGRFDKPWQGKKTWASIESDFSISANCTSLGSVTFCVELRGLQGAPEEWRVDVGLVSEFGQLEQIAKNSESFFNADT